MLWPRTIFFLVFVFIMTIVFISGIIIIIIKMIILNSTDVSVEPNACIYRSYSPIADGVTSKNSSVLSNTSLITSGFANRVHPLE